MSVPGVRVVSRLSSSQSVQEVQKFADEAISCYCECGGQKGTADGETYREGSHGAIVLHFVQTNRNDQGEFARGEELWIGWEKIFKKELRERSRRDEITDASWVPRRSVCVWGGGGKDFPFCCPIKKVP